MKERILTNIEPKQVFKYFEDLTFIPRESGNEKEVSDYIVSFAEDHGLEWKQDEALNVIIRKPASAGYEDHPGVMMQAHMDMVCAKKSWSEIDFTKDPIEFEIEGDKIIARETTLGADDGIGVALIMALLADESISHPKLEAVFTTEEETGLFGVEKIDFDKLTGSYVISLDAADEGVAVIGCAGGPVICSKIPVIRMDTDSSFNCYKIKIQGLLGGHSGEDIHRGRAHAVKLMGELLAEIRENSGESFVLAAFRGGDKSNSISRTAEAVIGIIPGFVDTVRGETMTLQLLDTATVTENLIDTYAEKMKTEYKLTDPGISVTWEKVSAPAQVLAPDSMQRILDYINLSDSGIVRMDEEFPHLVESSVNLGAVRIRPEHAEFWHVVRSSKRDQAEMMAEKIYKLTEQLGGEYSVPAGSPPWPADPDSKIRETYIKVYEELFGEIPEMMVLHAALEPCKIAPRVDRRLDMIAFGPDVRNLHAPGEYLTISSTQKMWKTLKALLAEL